jgi:hypothetical protein
MSSNLNAISNPLVLEPAPLVARSRSRTVANGDSMTLVVRRCFQCSAGKSKKVTRRSQWAASELDRLGVLGLILRLETRPCGLAVSAGLGVHHLVQRALGARLKPLGQLVEHVDQLVAPAGLLARSGHTSRNAAQNPNAPSPTAKAGATIPRRLSLAQQRLPALGALPVAVLDRDNSFSPSGRAPIITRVQSRSSSSLMLKCTPSTHT